MTVLCAVSLAPFSRAGTPAPHQPPPDGFQQVYATDDVVFLASIAPESRQGLEGVDLSALAAPASVTIQRVSLELGLARGEPLRIYLAPSSLRARATLGLPPIPEWASGAAFGASGEILVIVGKGGTYPDRDLPGVIAHECVHVLLDRALAGSGVRAPRWFHEGFAVLESRPWGWNDALILATTVLPSTPPPLATLDERFPADESAARAAYAISVSFVEFLERRHRPGLSLRLARDMSDGLSLNEAAVHATGEDLAALEGEWRRGFSIYYRWIPILTSSAAVWSVTLALLFLAGARRRSRRRALEEIWERTGYAERDADDTERYVN